MSGRTRNSSQYLAGKWEIEFNPQGNAYERTRAGSAGVPAVDTKIAKGTELGKLNGEREGVRFLV
jgi:acyl CoA:acetate/3-ketoacid CoA transferase alpha subunit